MGPGEVSNTRYIVPALTCYHRTVPETSVSPRTSREQAAGMLTEAEAEAMPSSSSNSHNVIRHPDELLGYRGSLAISADRRFS